MRSTCPWYADWTARDGLASGVRKYLLSCAVSSELLHRVYNTGAYIRISLDVAGILLL